MRQKKKARISPEIINTYKELLQVMDAEKLDPDDQLLLTICSFSQLKLTPTEQKICVLRSMPSEKKQLCEIGFDLQTFTIYDAIRSSFACISENDVSKMLYAKRQQMR